MQPQPKKPGLQFHNFEHMIYVMDFWNVKAYHSSIMYTYSSRTPNYTPDEPPPCHGQDIPARALTLEF